MTLTDERKILGNKIKVYQAQYDLGREAAKISAFSFKDLLEKYEYLTGEDLGHRLSALEKTKFEYSPLGKVFTKGLDKDDKEEGLLKRLRNIEDKNEELPNALSETIKAGKNYTYEGDFYYDPTYNFRRFYRNFGKFKTMASLNSKHGELIDLYNKYFNASKDEYDSEDLSE